MIRYVLLSRNHRTSFDMLVKINKTADRMYALFAICNALSLTRVDDNISNIVKERYGEQFSKMSRGCVRSLLPSPFPN